MLKVEKVIGVEPSEKTVGLERNFIFSEPHQILLVEDLFAIQALNLEKITFLIVARKPLRILNAAELSNPNFRYIDKPGPLNKRIREIRRNPRTNIHIVESPFVVSLDQQRFKKSVSLKVHSNSPYTTRRFQGGKPELLLTTT